MITEKENIDKIRKADKLIGEVNRSLLKKEAKGSLRMLDYTLTLRDKISRIEQKCIAFEERR